MSIVPLNGLSPALNFASRALARPGHHWGPRVIPDYQLFYMIKGGAELLIASRAWRIQEGECIFLEPSSPHILTLVETSDYISLHFSLQADSPLPVHPALLVRNVPRKRLAEPPRNCSLMVDGYGEIEIPRHFSLPSIEALMMRIVQEYGQDTPGSAFLLRALMMELIMAIVRHQMALPFGRPSDRFASALTAMTEQPARNWTVSELAALCGYHPGYFTRVFCETFGTNPKQFLMSERIKLAKQALLRGETIEQIADRLGYASVHYFGNNFKKMTGITPGEFRQLPIDPEAPGPL